MKKRTFGWVQDASNLSTLRKVVKGLVKDTDEYNRLLNLIPKYIVDKKLADKMKFALANAEEYPYILLKGTSGEQLTVEQNKRLFGLSDEDAEEKSKKGGRANASCTGIIQLSLTAQTKNYYKPYQNDWSAESYLKLAVSLDLISYDAKKDTCKVTDFGLKISLSNDKELEKAYIISMMKYPPAVRVLQILAEDMQPHTKFEIGSKLGFIGEAGFGSMDMGYYLWVLNSADKTSRSEVKANKEKMCDKYARMTCSMLKSLGLIGISKKLISAEFAGIKYGPEELTAYKITAKGYDALNNRLFRFISNRKLEELFCDNIHYMYYKPYIHMMFDGMDISGINNFISLFDVIKDKQIISLGEYNDVYDNAVDIVNKNNRLLDDFHESSKKYIKRITKNI